MVSCSIAALSGHIVIHTHAHAHTRTRPPTHSPSHTIPSHTCSIAASSFSDASLTRSRALVSSMSACSGIAADTKHGATVYSMIVSKMYCSVTEKKIQPTRSTECPKCIGDTNIYILMYTHTHTHTFQSCRTCIHTRDDAYTHQHTHIHAHTFKSCCTCIHIRYDTGLVFYDTRPQLVRYIIHTHTYTHAHTPTPTCTPTPTPLRLHLNLRTNRHKTWIVSYIWSVYAVWVAFFIFLFF